MRKKHNADINSIVKLIHNQNKMGELTEHVCKTCQFHKSFIQKDFEIMHDDRKSNK